MIHIQSDPIILSDSIISSLRFDQAGTFDPSEPIHLIRTDSSFVPEVYQPLLFLVIGSRGVSTRRWGVSTPPIPGYINPSCRRCAMSSVSCPLWAVSSLCLVYFSGVSTINRVYWINPLQSESRSSDPWSFSANPSFGTLIISLVYQPSIRCINPFQIESPSSVPWSISFRHRARVDCGTFALCGCRQSILFLAGKVLFLQPGRAFSHLHCVIRGLSRTHSHCPSSNPPFGFPSRKTREGTCPGHRA